MPLLLGLSRLVNVTEQTAKQALPHTLKCCTFAIIEKRNIKGLVGFGGVGWAAVSGYCDRC